MKHHAPVPPFVRPSWLPSLTPKKERRYWEHIADDINPLPSDFGSLLDWSPIGHDEDDLYGPGLVLVCCNTESPSYGHVSIATNNLRGRRSYFNLGIGIDAFISDSETLMASADTRELSSHCVYVCDMCEKAIRYKDGPWLQAMKTRHTAGTVDICNDCQPTIYMQSLLASASS